MASPGSPLPELVLYTGDDCQLCDDALETIRDVLARRGTAGLPMPVLRTVKVTGDPRLRSGYRERLPVVGIGGEELDLVISPRRLAHLLERVLDGVTTA